MGGREDGGAALTRQVSQDLGSGAVASRDHPGN